MYLNTATFNDFVTNADIKWTEGFKMIEPKALNSGLFMIDPLRMGTGEDKEYSEIDSENFLQIGSEGSRNPELLAQQGYNKRMVYYVRKGKVSITKEMRDENKYKEVERKLLNLGKYVPQTRERDLTLRFTYANATSYTQDGKTIDVSAPDGLAMCYSAHTLRGTSTTYRNRLTGDPLLSTGSLETAGRLQNEEILNQFGQKQVVMFNVLVTGMDRATCNTAAEILQSTAKISAPNEGVKNVWQAEYRHVKLPYLDVSATGAPDSTKRAYWFLGSTENEPFIYSPAIEADTKAWEDEDTRIWHYSVYSKYGICGINPRGLIGSFPTSS